MAEKGPKKFSRFMRHFPTTKVQGTSMFSQIIKNVCSASTSVNIKIGKHLVKYPVFCVNDNDF